MPHLWATQTGGSGSGEKGERGEKGETGERGEQGVKGFSVLHGSGEPSNAIGNNEEFYLDTAAEVLYGPKTAGAWPKPGVSLKGPAGTNGTNGTNGEKGEKGLTGEKGERGETGVAGTAGEWVECTLNETFVKQRGLSSEGQTFRVRKIGTYNVQLRGALNTTSIIKNGALLFTLPESYRPPGIVFIDMSSSGITIKSLTSVPYIEIATNGEAKARASTEADLPQSGNTIFFDNMQFNIT